MPARHHVDPAAALRAVRVAAAAQRADRVRCARTGGRHADERADADRRACRTRPKPEEDEHDQ